MKKLLWIRDSKKFWKVFSQERKKSRRRLQNLSFAKKIELLEKWKQQAGVALKHVKMPRL